MLPKLTQEEQRLPHVVRQTGHCLFLVCFDLTAASPTGSAGGTSRWVEVSSERAAGGAASIWATAEEGSPTRQVSPAAPGHRRRRRRQGLGSGVWKTLSYRPLTTPGPALLQPQAVTGGFLEKGSSGLGRREVHRTRRRGSGAALWETHSELGCTQHPCPALAQPQVGHPRPFIGGPRRPPSKALRTLRAPSRFRGPSC